ncbi:MAG: hypothetical protein ABJC19_11530 [Gemmatimonadota bacterium]
MRKPWIATLPLLGALLLAAAPASAQVRVSVNLGPPAAVYSYTPEAYGDWNTSYTQWQPATLYYSDGHYYPRPVRNARVVQVYRYRNAYFFPPRDKGWDNKDKRYNYSHRPLDDDWGRAMPPKAKGHAYGKSKGKGKPN